MISVDGQLQEITLDKLKVSVGTISTRDGSVDQNPSDTFVIPHFKWKTRTMNLESPLSVLSESHPCAVNSNCHHF